MADLYERRLKYLEKARQAYKTKLESIDPHVRVMRNLRKQFNNVAKNKMGLYNKKNVSALLDTISRIYGIDIPHLGTKGRLDHELFYATYMPWLYHEMFHIERAYIESLKLNVGLEN